MSKESREIILTLEEQILTVGQTSTVLKVSTNTVYKLIREGELRALKLGRLKIPVFEIERFIKENLDRDMSEFIC